MFKIKRRIIPITALCLIMFLSFNANAAQPTVTTSVATLITAESAQMNGSVNPNGAGTTYYFEYGLTAAYGLTTDALNAGSGTVGVAVSADMLGCSGKTTYYFRLVATNSAGTTYGAGKTFTTTGVLKPTVTTSSATSITAATARLNGTINTNGLLTTYYFQYGTTTSYGLTTKSPRSGSERASFTASKSISGLSQNTIYHFRIVATNSAGTAYGTDKTFTTPISVTKPTATTGTASPVTDTTATLNGTVNPNGAVTTCYFQYGTSTGYGKNTPTQSKAAGTISTSVMAAVISLTPDTTYHFRLAASNSGGTTYGSDKTFTTDSAAQEETFTNSLNMTFNLIPAGTFTMGSPSDEPGRSSDETQHQVTLTNDYYMQTTEVTQGQWKAVMGSNPSYFQNCGDECPVENVSWEDIQKFLFKINDMGEGSYLLPTEAQWEYAARAGSTTAFANGGITELQCNYDPNLNAMGWYCGNGESKTHFVAQKSPNSWGLYDMHGNVWEWCNDWYGSYATAAVTDPVGPGGGSSRVIRGGSWAYYAYYCRSAFRYNFNPSNRRYYFGFRLVRLAE